MYEYRETWYTVCNDGTEIESNWRFTTDNMRHVMERFETSIHDFCHTQKCELWDLLTLEICRMNNNDREVLASVKLYADDIQA